MKRTPCIALALTFLNGPVAMAQPKYPERSDQGDYRGDYGSRHSRGDRLPDQYRQTLHVVSDWRQRGLRNSPKGYQWVAGNDHRGEVDRRPLQRPARRPLRRIHPGHHDPGAHPDDPGPRLPPARRVLDRRRLNWSKACG